MTLGEEFPQDLFGILPKDKIKRLVIRANSTLKDEDLKQLEAFDRVQFKLSKTINSLLYLVLKYRILPRKELALDYFRIDRDVVLKAFLRLN